MQRASGGGAPSSRRLDFRVLAVVATFSDLGACSGAGDFGRGTAAGDPARKSAHDPQHTGSISSFALTDDERQLRDLARGLLAPPAERERSLLPGSNDPSSEPDSAEGYVANLVDGPFRSSAARYSRLVDDTRNDITRLEPFFLAARRVADLDVKRDRSLPHVSQLKQDELLNAKRRVRENMMLIAEVHHVMLSRTLMYRTALERLVIALPSPLAVEAERQRLELERRLAAISVFAAGPQPVAEPAVVKR